MQVECANTLKKNSSLNLTLSDEDKKEETDYDEEGDTNLNDTVAFIAVVYLKVTSLHDARSSVDDDELLYSDKEDEKVLYDEIQENYNLMYTK